MRAAIYHQFQGPIAVENVPDPVAPLDGVVIEVAANGICRSDWHGWMGHDPDITLPHVPGHELAGTIAAVGRDVSGWRVGDRVTAPFACGCGRCEQCVSGNQHICDDYFQPGFTAWGAFAEYVAIPHAAVNLVRLPEPVSFIDAAGLGCRFITAYRAVVDQGRVAPGEWVVVYGCGGVGLSAVMVAAAAGAQVIAVDISDEVLALAASVGATHRLNARRESDVPAAVKALTGGGAHVAIDALGSHETARNGILSLRKRGRHVQVGLLLGGEADPPLPMSAVIGGELEIVGSHGMQAWAYRPLLDQIVSGRLDPGRLVNRIVSLEAACDLLMRLDTFPVAGVTVITEF